MELDDKGGDAVHEGRTARAAHGTAGYDPFARGPFPVGVRAIGVADPARGQTFPGEVWYPAAVRHAGEDLDAATQDRFTLDPSVSASDGPPTARERRQAAVRDAEGRPGVYPVVVFSHHGGGNRRTATFLTTHLSSHGYVVAAVDHAERVLPELAPGRDETGERRAARVEAMIANRVPDVRVLLDWLLDGPGWDAEARPDPGRVGIVGHSFGGWTALAAPDVEPRIRAVVALAPAGNSTPLPGVIPAALAFAWGRDVPTLFLVADQDTPLPLDGMDELLERTPATKRMVILRRADHGHFADNVEEEHEAVRAMSWDGDGAWIPKRMRPISELCSGDEAHLFTRGLTVAHLDATLLGHDAARRFLAGDVDAELARRGVAARSQRP
jgi:predicted dienelactone hydrolase